MSDQLRLWEDPVPVPRLSGRTYIYIRQDGKCVHCNAIGGFIGEEYEHDDLDWQPSGNWPYEIIDMRKEKNEG